MPKKTDLYFYATPNFKVYHGFDLDGKTSIDAIKDGATISVSEKKAEVLLKDYPLNFSESKERPEAKPEEPPIDTIRPPDKKPGKADGSILDKALGGGQDGKAEDKEKPSESSSDKK